MERENRPNKALQAAMIVGVVGSVGGTILASKGEVFAQNEGTEANTQEVVVKPGEVESEIQEIENFVSNHPTPIERHDEEMILLNTYIPEQENRELQIADSFTFPLVDGKVSGRNYMDRYLNHRGIEVFHPGEDWNWYPSDAEEVTGFEDLGRDVLTIANAECVFAANVGEGLGNVVIMKHLIDVNGRIRAIYSQYAHLNEIKAEVGEVYDQGYILGTVGHTGEYEYPHLDFQMFDEFMYENYVLRLGPNFTLAGFTEDLLRSHHFHPTLFINYRNSLNN
jgi:hypothetical protein